MNTLGLRPSDGCPLGSDVTRLPPEGLGATRTALDSVGAGDGGSPLPIAGVVLGEVDLGPVASWSLLSVVGGALITGARDTVRDDSGVCGLLPVGT